MIYSDLKLKALKSLKVVFKEFIWTYKEQNWTKMVTYYKAELKKVNKLIAEFE